MGKILALGVNNLRNRGVEDILIRRCGTAFKGFARCHSMPPIPLKTTVQHPMCHLVPIHLNFCEWKDRQERRQHDSSGFIKPRMTPGGGRKPLLILRPNGGQVPVIAPSMRRSVAKESRHPVLRAFPPVSAAKLYYTTKCRLKGLKRRVIKNAPKRARSISH